MRKAVIATLALALALCGCDSNGVKREEGAKKLSMDGRFLCDSGAYSFETVVDTKTGVTYLIWTNGGYRAGITVLMDRDGKPIISEEIHV